MLKFIMEDTLNGILIAEVETIVGGEKIKLDFVYNGSLYCHLNIFFFTKSDGTPLYTLRDKIKIDLDEPLNIGLGETFSPEQDKILKRYIIFQPTGNNYIFLNGRKQDTVFEPIFIFTEFELNLLKSKVKSLKI